MREVMRPLIGMLAMLIVIFATYSSSRFLADAVEGLLETRTVLILTGLKALIALEVLIPVSLYLSVMAALGRLYNDSEITAMQASGRGPAWLVKTVATLALLLALPTALLSIQVRPWAYALSYSIEKQAEAKSDLSRLLAGHFYHSQDSTRTIFVEKLSEDGLLMDKVFVRMEMAGSHWAIAADHGTRTVNDATSQQILTLFDVHAYHLLPLDKPSMIGRFNRVTLNITPPNVKPVEYKSKSASMGELLVSDNLADKAELQWRLSTPVSTIIMALLAVPLSHVRPRQGKYAKLLAAILIYAVYYNLIGMAKTWVGHGSLPVIPGIWWVPALLVLLLFALLAPAPEKFWVSRQARKSP
ncbi:MAG: LPS export ABC transporter permease LptF [Gammaproteobacteria bacterium HGW-Gammaproteobacteria-3]|nr:MAG: LPS export ABC transporter permease LptF [Gammaproteobacteria bacterium HGW-Gammaproteobacteria-3]